MADPTCRLDDEVEMSSWKETKSRRRRRTTGFGKEASPVRESERGERSAFSGAGPGWGRVRAGLELELASVVAPETC